MSVCLSGVSGLVFYYAVVSRSEEGVISSPVVGSGL